MRFVSVLASMLLSGAAFADVMVGGMAMFPTKNIIENAVNSADHTTLVAAVKAASSSGPTRFKKLSS